MINSQTISTIYHSRIKEQIQHLNEDKPTLVGFLANMDPAAKMYARWTKNACEKEESIASALVKLTIAASKFLSSNNSNP